MSQELVNPDVAVGAACAFNTTQWTAVLAATNQEEAGSLTAFQQLCESYWYPIFAYLRREGNAEEEAKDLAQGFFAHLIERGLKLERGRDGGRFRSFLLRALKNYTLNEWKKSQRLRRGGGLEIVSLTLDDFGARYDRDAEIELSPERLFERKWAKALMAQVTKAIEREYLKSGKRERLRVLLPWLIGAESSMGYAEAARRLNISEGATRGAVHRLRARFRELFRREVEQLVEDPAAVDDEIRYIVQLLSE